MSLPASEIGSNPGSRLKHIILISTPWPLYSRPSIQLGSLKAYLNAQFPGLEIRALHPYLKVAEEVGYEIYSAISDRTWLAESVCGALLFPERKKGIEKMFYREASRSAKLRGLHFGALISQVGQVLEKVVRDVDWTSCGLVGFSICLCQLTSSLYLIKQIKQCCPGLPVVVGGSMFSGGQAYGLARSFPEIDYVVNGEGELPLSRLIRYIGSTKQSDKLLPMPGVIARKEIEVEDSVGFDQLESLNDLPPPDYDDYFDVLKSLRPEKRFFPTLPAEVSRGCWWKSTPGNSKHTGCAFCNLNLQWDGYRSKNVSQVVAEIDCLTTKYRTLSVAFMDNLLPSGKSKEIFSQLAGLEKDLRLFAEIRSTTSRKMLMAMKKAGTHKIQVGIEALSTKLLRKLHKGTTAIQNMQIMRDCEELGISNNSNIIIHFPGSDAEDVDETLRTLDFAFPFRPLRLVRFWLGLGSPVWHDFRGFGLKAVFNHRNYGILFPPEVCRSISFMIQSYRGDLGYQRKLWQPVKKRLLEWKKSYADIHGRGTRSPILSFLDGRDFLIIRQKRYRAEALTHRLVGPSRAIYLFCQQHRSLKHIVEHFPKTGADKVAPFLKMMVDKKLVYEENDRYLSLAVPAPK
ncbi:MAG: RiPP maturation radical SAM C-methyltransferase [Deltaproteobacteria bacterium]|nr:RiPP maturation radical SAM C-methyltransferase [Deltaproteobacteria bacterium]